MPETAIVVVSLGQRRAPADLRSAAAVPADRAPDWLRSAVARPAVDEAGILSTCNRVEAYAITRDRETAERSLMRQLAEHGGISVDRLRAGARVFHDDAACEHVCRVAAGLDSMMIGEAEILGQIRTAAACAREAGTLGPTLERLFAGALGAGRRVRSETALGIGTTSVPAAAVVLAERVVRGLAGRSVLAIGAGAAGQIVVSRVAKRRPATLYLANRSPEPALRLAQKFGASAMPLEKIPDVLKEVDVVISAAFAPAWLITRAMLGDAVASRPRPLVLVDVGMPPAIEPAIAGPGVTQFALDDLRSIAEETARRRAAEIPSAEAIVRDEARRLVDRWRLRSRRERQEVPDVGLAVV